jgi:hypothetical protein
MNRSPRQLLPIVALVIAGAASLATSQSYPGIHQETKDHLSFSGDQRSQTRHIRIELAPGNNTVVDVSATIMLETGAINGKEPFAVSVTRDSGGGAPLHSSYFEPGPDSTAAGFFDVVTQCDSGSNCSESFTVIFMRIPEDTRPTLEFDWSLQTGGMFQGLSPEDSVPADASLVVTISQ